MTTRRETGLLNLRENSARLEVRRNFFSQVMVQDWNRILSEVKMGKCSRKFMQNSVRGWSDHRG
jgi:hypothetical protein